MSFKSTLMGAIAAFAFAVPAFAEIEVHDPYARSSNAMAGAAFMVIHNSGEEADRLIDVASDAAARVELHTHIEDADGVMRMTHVEEGFELPAGGEIVMKRGAEHVMFMGLTAPFEQDEMIVVTLTFEKAGDITIEIPVDLTREESEMMMQGDGDEADHGSDG